MSRRLDRVNELLKREISAVVQREFEFKGSLVTVNAVEVAPDLKEARVFVGVMGGRETGVIERLSQNRGLIQSKVSKRVVLRNTPVLTFVQDASVERGVDIVNLLDEVAKLPTAPPKRKKKGRPIAEVRLVEDPCSEDPYHRRPGGGLPGVDYNSRWHKELHLI